MDTAAPISAWHPAVAPEIDAFCLIKLPNIPPIAKAFTTSSILLCSSQI